LQASENTHEEGVDGGEIEMIDPVFDSQLQNSSSIVPEPMHVEEESLEQAPTIKEHKLQAPDKINRASATYRAIEMAKAAGARVVDGRTDGGAVVVQLVSEASQHRVVIRTLLNVGFERCGGMEFRK
jgi:hypothetical protein